MTPVNLSMKQTDSQTRQQTCDYQAGRSGSLDSADANHHTQTGQTARLCCCRTGNYHQHPPKIMMEKNGKKNVCVRYNWVTFLYTRNQHNIVNQVYFNKTNFFKK